MFYILFDIKIQTKLPSMQRDNTLTLVVLDRVFLPLQTV